MNTYVFNIGLFFSYTFISLIISGVMWERSMLDAKIVGRIIQKYRLEKGWSQEVLSDFAEIHRTHLSAIERGERRPSLDTFCRIGYALGVGPAVLLNAIEVEMESEENSKESKESK